MARSAANATRFTATKPHAYSNPNPFRPIPQSLNTPLTAEPGSVPRPPPPPKPETPQEKVARLRALRTAQRNAALPIWDRIVLRGRKWADRAHKVTALSLIGAGGMHFPLSTGICFFVGTFAIGDMLIHNRRKRTAFINEQHRIYSSRLLAAIETEKAGITLTPEQDLVLTRERANALAEQKKDQKRMRPKIRNFFMGGLKEEDRPGPAPIPTEDRERIEKLSEGKIPTEAEVLELLGVGSFDTLAALQGKRQADMDAGRKLVVSESVGPITEKLEETKREAEQEMNTERGSSVGGVFDQMADNLVRRMKGEESHRKVN
ncbi:uncharacterized protein KY384_005415 [Bacidia gigantensis]|uniref:uncharacterized protein n=1 Tax=Bacidia gigantensis TaxID=2732470 RepID=UPI001D03C578|nr:uncharacterized protein KY384_005415 [Bacidia gigantensis]KAG8529934.1 hypothetical protein KY384_005415 [Bacidia gigantensis]